MAEIVKTVRIETGGGERTVKSLRKEISDLRDALLNMDKGGEDWVKTAQELTKAQEELNSVMKAGKQEMDADASSISGMEARYKSLYQTYRLLSQEQRKSAEGISMQKELAELSKNLNNTKKDAGNFKDNIGHYADDMMNAFGQLGLSVGSLQGPFKLASQGANGFKNALSTLAKHPILLTLAALVGLFNKVREAIKGNEEYQLRMNKVAAAFKPIGDAMALVLDKIAGLAVKVAEGVAKVVKWVTDLFGVTRKLSAAEAELADKENQLITQRREFNELNSRDEARVQELMEEANLTENLKEKEELLNEARLTQERVNQRNIELRQKEYDIIKATNALTPSSTEDLNKENAALVALNQAREEGARKLRRIDNQVKSTRNSAASAAKEARKELDDILKRLEENSKTEIQKLEEKYAKEKKILEKYHKDTTELTKEYERNLDDLNAKANAKRTQAYFDTSQKIIEAYIQPSSDAFGYMIIDAQDKIYKFLADVTEVVKGVKIDPAELLIQTKGNVKKNLYAIFTEGIDNIYKDGKLNAKIKEISEVFNLGIEEGMDEDDIRERLKSLYSTLINNLTAARNGLRDWKKELSDGRAELELLKKTHEESVVADNYKDLESYAIALGEINKAEGDFLRDRAMKAKEAFEEIKNLDENELNSRGLTLNDQLDLERQYYEALEELRQHDLQNQLAMRAREKELEEEKRASITDLTMVSLDAMDQMLDTYKTLIEAYKRDGKISEQEAKKKAKTLQWLEGIQGAVAVAGIVADTASAWMSLDKQYAAELVLNAETAAATGPAAAATKAALDAKSLAATTIKKAAIVINGVAAAGAAVGKTIASIKALQGDTSGDSGSASVSAAPQLIDSTPYSYTRELQTDVEREEQLNTPIYVRVTDIDNVQARVRVTEQESTF